MYHTYSASDLSTMCASLDFSSLGRPFCCRFVLTLFLFRCCRKTKHKTRPRAPPEPSRRACALPRNRLSLFVSVAVFCAWCVRGCAKTPTAFFFSRIYVFFAKLFLQRKLLLMLSGYTRRNRRNRHPVIRRVSYAGPRSTS